MDERTQNHGQGRFEGEVLTRLDNIDRRLDEFLPWLRNHETRIQKAEQEQVRVKTWGAALGFVAGLAASIFTKLIKW